MEQKQIRSDPVCDQLPRLSANYPWLVAQNLEAKDDTADHIFYTVHDPLSHYRRRIPELLGRRIRACFHGWVILSNNPYSFKWSLWNPVTSKFIHLPVLILKDGAYDDILDCCLSSPPDDPGSILLLTRLSKPNFVFCRLGHKRKKWTEMSYSKQLMTIARIHEFLLQPTCFDGKVYALTNDYSCVIHVDIVVNGEGVLITLSEFVMLPDTIAIGCHLSTFLKGSCSDLFTITVCYTDLTKKGFTDLTTKKPVGVFLSKLDITSMEWYEVEDLNGTVFFVDMALDPSVTCSPAIASELGGYIHILHETGKVICSYNVNDKTISLSSMHCLDLPPRSEVSRRSRISVWAMPEFRLQGDNGETKCKDDCKQMVVRSTMNYEIEFNSKMNEAREQNDEAYLLKIPFHVLETIMGFCVGVEYLNFRATCKRCRSAASEIHFSNATVQKRLQTYSLDSPWMMTLTYEKDRGGIITFTDPMFGDKYYLMAYEDLPFENRILCCRYGWLLFMGHHKIVFLNLFTSDIRKLPPVPHVESFCFSGPPTSPNCMVVGFSSSIVPPTVYIYYLDQPQPFWFELELDFGGVDPFLVGFPIFYGSDIYALSNEGVLQVFNDDNFTLRPVICEAPISCSSGSMEYFLVACDQHLLLVIVGEFGESVEVFKLKDSTQEWEKMDSLGRHMVYICGRTCLCMNAKIPEMENKIYFPRLHSENGKMVFYSLETHRYHTFNGGNVEESFEDFFVTKELALTHAWIEPNWS